MNNSEIIIQKAMDFRKNVLKISDDDSIDKFEKLVEKAGFFLLITSFPGEYDSEEEKGFLYSGENIELIFVNNSNYYCAQNFTVWHEVYHALESHDDFDFVDEEEKNIIEKEANIFASTILIPPKSLEKKLKDKIMSNKLYISDIHRISLDYNCHYQVAYLQIKRVFPDFYSNNKYFKNLYYKSDNFDGLTNNEIQRIKELRKNRNYYLTPKVVDVLLSNYKKGLLPEEKLKNLIQKIREVTRIEN